MTTRPGCAHQRGWILVVLLLGTVALGLVGFQPKAQMAKALPKPLPEPMLEPAVRSAGSSLQIVAHPDDDLFFMNPDLAQTIRTGAPVTTVYVTAAESNGKNVRKGGDVLARPDKPGYVTARHNGVRRAYAQMATGQADAKWVTATTPTPSGPVETTWLSTRPQVKLIFLDIAQMNPAGKATQLRGLWRGTVRAVHTVLGRGGPVTANRTYTRDQLITTLVALLQGSRPSVVRTQDPDPERGHDRHGADHRTDHPDHTATALLTGQAIDRYGRGGGSPLVVEPYRGYYNRHWPHNLSGAAVTEKLKLIGIYGWADKDTAPCHEESGCGDLRVAGTSANGGWPQGTHHRYPGTARWLVRQPDGRLAAYAVVSGRVHRWEERTPGGAWQPGVAMSDSGFTPDLGLVPLAGGRSALLGVRIIPGPPGVIPRHRIVMAVQDRPTGAFGHWTDLGNPAENDQDGQRDVGAAAAAADGAGRITVFARNADLGVSARTQTARGGFGQWRKLGGQRIQDGLAAATDRAGRIELFGPAKPRGWRWKRSNTMPGLWHWRQKRPGGPMDHGAWFGTGTAVTGPLTLAADPTGALTLVARRPGSGETAAFHQNTTTGVWPTQPSMLTGPGGFGPVGVVAPSPGVLGLAGRNGQGTVGIFETGSWLDSGGLFVHSPGIAVDARGQLVVAVLGIDGLLHVARRGPDSSWHWQPVP